MWIIFVPLIAGIAGTLFVISDKVNRDALATIVAILAFTGALMVVIATYAADSQEKFQRVARAQGIEADMPLWRIDVMHTTAPCKVSLKLANDRLVIESTNKLATPEVLEVLCSADD